jgi:hypothetical protein
MIKQFFRGIAFRVMLRIPPTQWAWVMDRKWIQSLVDPPQTPKAMVAVIVEEPLLPDIVWHPAPPEKRVAKVFDIRTRRAWK